MATAGDEPRERLETALACAALERGLRSVLLLDADADVLATSVETLSAYLAAVHGRRVRTLRVGAWLGEDELWARPELAAAPGGGLTVAHRAGPLAATASADELPLVVVPDLALLDLPAARGLLTVVDADCVHLERHGESRAWRPETWWLAGCARDAVGRISPHLLDRFLLRVDAGGRVADGRQERLQDELEDRVPTAALRGPSADEVGRASVRSAALSEAGLDRVLAVAGTVRTVGARRDLALGRLALGHARLTGVAVVGDREVDAAAALIGLTASEAAGTDGVTAPEAFDQPGPRADGGVTPLPGQGGAGGGPGESGDAIVVAAADAQPLEDATLVRLPAPPYPEDDAEAGQDFTPLREGAVRARSRSVPRGTIIGVERARTANDLALTATLLAAARWQPYRGARRVDRLVLRPEDLRRYRRAPLADRILVLVVDFTSVGDADWGALVLPYFRWAYVERAEVCLVRVGADDARVATRADRILARNLLDPRLDRALSAGPGQSTPLAHGLQLALNTLRHKLQHGQGAVRDARLVVVTDGRGNVPLQLDPNLAAPAPVGAAGVEDAVTVAQAIQPLKVERVLVDPGVEVHRHVFERLAAALAARVVTARGQDEVAA